MVQVRWSSTQCVRLGKLQVTSREQLALIVQSVSIVTYTLLDENIRNLFSGLSDVNSHP
jgi:hypothetical protein